MALTILLSTGCPGSDSGKRPCVEWSVSGEDLGVTDFGSIVASAGDVNGDGYPDVAIGTVGGLSFVFHGEAGGVQETPVWSSPPVVEPWFFGQHFACVGDVDGDGYSDLLQGDSRRTTVTDAEGTASLFRGGPQGLDTAASWSVSGDDQEGARFGHSVALAGDVNGDGFSDLLIGAPWFDGVNLNTGKVYLYLGSPTGPSPLPDWTLLGEDVGLQMFGEFLSTAGDINSDGYSDILLATRGWVDNVLIFLGGPTGPAPTPDLTVPGPPDRSTSFGSAIACAGDVNGDGYSDIIIGDPGYDHWKRDNVGRAHLYIGLPGGLFLAWSKEGESRWASQFGLAVSSAGDVDGDGLDDVIVGTNCNSGSTEAGKAFLFLGRPEGLTRKPAWTRRGRRGSASGGSVASAGDVDQDGRSEFIVGALGFFSGMPGKATIYCYRK